MGLDFTPTGFVTLENEFEKVKREGDKSYELGANRKHPDLVIEVVVSSGIQTLTNSRTLVKSKE